MKEAIVLYTVPGMGHLVSMVELGKLILNHHHPSLSIHILIPATPFNSPSISAYISTVSSSVPSITFHHLSALNLSPSATSTSSRHLETLLFASLRLINPQVQQYLLDISHHHAVRALVLDFFCAVSLSFAADLNIPAYFYFPSGASFLASMLYLSTLHENSEKSFKDQNTLLHIPGLPPLPTSAMVKAIVEQNDEAYDCFLHCSSSLAKSAGIITNTFNALEPRAIAAVSDGLCVPHHPMPPIYCVGPLIDGDRSSGHLGGTDSVPECLTWLNSQPSRSVVFLCFGSGGVFSNEQLKEIADGLEKSGQRFLWVVRNPPSDTDQSAVFRPQPDPDLNHLLPVGFMNRTKERGLVVKSWAPQVAVLSHDSVGGFVTHCGWNSVLEAVRAGVPMVAWPLYAEQRLNRIVMVEEMKIALPMIESENGLVSSEEVEKRVRELMESDKGKVARDRTVMLKEEAKAALSEDGSSRIALTQLVESWKLQIS